MSAPPKHGSQSYSTCCISMDGYARLLSTGKVSTLVRLDDQPKVKNI